MISDDVLYIKNEMKKLFGLIDDDTKAIQIVYKLMSYHVFDYSDVEDCPGYYIIFFMQTKVLIDSLFDKSREYIELSRTKGMDGHLLLNITDIMKVYAPDTLNFLNSLEED